MSSPWTTNASRVCTGFRSRRNGRRRRSDHRHHELLGESAAETVLTDVSDDGVGTKYKAKSYALRDVQASHITYACEKATDLAAGAIINCAFL